MFYGSDEKLRELHAKIQWLQVSLTFQEYVMLYLSFFVRLKEQQLSNRKYMH